MSACVLLLLQYQEEGLITRYKKFFKVVLCFLYDTCVRGHQDLLKDKVAGKRIVRNVTVILDIRYLQLPYSALCLAK